MDPMTLVKDERVWWMCWDNYEYWLCWCSADLMVVLMDLRKSQSFILLNICYEFRHFYIFFPQSAKFKAHT